MFLNLRNKFDFFIRNTTKFSRKNFVVSDERLLKRNQAENDYVYDILEKYFSKKGSSNVKVLDIGCKNWFYIRGLHKYFETFCNYFRIDGVELDPYRLYTNFYSRYETAKFYMRDLDNVNYIAGNLLEINTKYDYITWFLPFVLEYPHTAWGLPKEYFCPEKLLKHAYELLNDNGQLLIINQGEEEASVQEKLFKSLNIPYKNYGEVASKFFDYKHKRYLFTVQK